MKTLLIVLTSLLLISCGQVPVERYANEKPVLDLPTYFSGPVQAWGMFQDRSGEVIKRFHVDIQSRRDGEPSSGTPLTRRHGLFHPPRHSRNRKPRAALPIRVRI